MSIERCPNRDGHLPVMMRYVVGGARAKQKERLLDRMRQTGQKGELRETIAEALLAEGEARGEAEG